MKSNRPLHISLLLFFIFIPSQASYNGKRDYFTYLPEDSLVRQECQRVGKSWNPFSKRQIKKNCIEINSWLEKFSQPQPRISTSQGWLEFLVLATNAKHMHSLIAGVLPDATDGEKKNEFNLLSNAATQIEKNMQTPTEKNS